MALGVIGGLIIIFNWCCFVSLSKSSMAPVIGGIFAAIGVYICPNESVSQLWWIPPIIDPGCVIYTVCFVSTYLIPKRKTKRPPA